MDTSTLDDDKRQQLRRKLLRGSFSVPAVLAVHNGSALAAGSSNMGCIRNPIEGVAKLLQTQESGTVPVYADGPSDATLYWAKISDLQKLAVSPIVNGVSSNGSNIYVRFWNYGVIYHPDPGFSPTAPAGYIQGLFRVDGNGTSSITSIIGFLQPGESTNTESSKYGFISGTCWGSLLKPV